MWITRLCIVEKMGKNTILYIVDGHKTAYKI